MRKINKKNIDDLSHERSTNPFIKKNIYDRYSEAKLVDMRDNYIIEKKENGYLLIKPVDPNKKY